MVVIVDVATRDWTTPVGAANRTKSNQDGDTFNTKTLSDIENDLLVSMKFYLLFLERVEINSDNENIISDK